MIHRPTEFPRSMPSMSIAGMMQQNIIKKTTGKLVKMVKNGSTTAHVYISAFTCFSMYKGSRC